VVTSDGSGGAIIAWSDWRKDEYGNEYKAAYAQRINASGTIMWGTGGIALKSPDINGPGSVRMISDGAGGAVITWDQWVGNYPNGNRDIFAQKISNNGGMSWGSSGFTVCSHEGDQSYPEITGDGNGGAIIIWEDYRTGSSGNLYAQRITAAGTIQWTENGVKASSTSSSRYQRLLSDGNGGAFFTWKTGTSVVYVQLINSNGITQWADNGTAVGGSANNPQITTDGTGGALITWENSSGDILTQRINASGTVLWHYSGVYVCQNQDSQWSPHITFDGNGGAIISWDDYRNNAENSTDIYAQQISGNGTLGVTTGININREPLPSGFTLYQNYPNPFSVETIINYRIERRSDISLQVVNTSGIEVATLVNGSMEPGNYSVKFDASGLPAGTYFYILNSDRGKEVRSMMLLK